ncbi:MFS transporter [Oceanicaulis sp.]|uniref:MFS transporter n=1 Tax=Oceanicaulis sp. TaxID=1924941 RepID=UPI003F6F653C
MATSCMRASTTDGAIGLIVYSAAHFGKSLLWTASSLFFAFFLTEIVGLPPLQMGMVLSISLFFNASMDFLTGRTLRPYVRTARSAARIQLIGAALAGLAFCAFSFTPYLAESVQTAYALISLLAFRMGYSLYDVPQNAYMALATHSDSRRANFAAARYIAAGISSLLIAGVLTPLVRNTPTADQAGQYLMLSALLVLVSTLCSLGLGLWSTLNTPPPKATVTPASVEQAIQPKALSSIWRDHGFTLLLAGIFSLSLTAPFFGKLEAYFSAYALSSDMGASGFMVSVALGQVCAQPLWSFWASRTSLETALLTAAGTLCAAGVYFLLMSHAGAFGALSSGALYGVALGGAAMVLWSLLARVASADPEQTTTRYGLFTFASKSAQGVALICLGWALAEFDYTDMAAARTLTLIMAASPFVAGLALSLIWSLMHRARLPVALT